ncbi:Abi-alpha family protein [Nocardioides ultimimeridianus]
MGPGDAIRPLLVASGALLRAAQRVEQEGQRLLPAPVVHAETPEVRRPAAREGGAAVVMAALQERALHQSTSDAEEALALAVLLLLVPDEARLLTALQRAGWVAAVDALPRPGSPVPALVGATLLGRRAGVALVDRTPAYLSRLGTLGLVEATEERPGHDQEYEILLAEPSVLRVLRSGRRAGRSPQTRRYGFVLTPLAELVLRLADPEAGP